MPRRVFTRDEIATIAKQYAFTVKFKSSFDVVYEILTVTVFDKGVPQFNLEFDCLSQEDGTFALRDITTVKRISAFLNDIGT
jgi:hypothetical protein